MSGKIALTPEEIEELYRMYEHIEAWDSMCLYHIKITKKGNLKVEGFRLDNDDV